MSTRIYGANDEHVKVFAKGTRVRFRRDVSVSKPMPNGVMGNTVVEKGEQGTIKSVFPHRIIQLDSGREISFHISIKLTDELEIVADKAKLRLVE